MARTEYTSRRRLMMQIVVWVVCATGIALAAGVVQMKASRTRVDLMPGQSVGGLNIRLPQGWMMEVGGQAGLHVIQCAEQPRVGSLGRALIVWRQDMRSQPDPLQFLMNNVLSDDGTDEADAGEAEWISVGGHKGVVLEFLHRTLVGRTIRSEQQTAACVVFQGGHVVVIRYVGHGDPNGKNLVRQIAQSIRLSDDGEDPAPARRPLPVDGAV